jgi:protein involved in polysaccharide export with SLBB domain
MNLPCARLALFAALATLPLAACTTNAPRPVEPPFRTHLELAHDGEFFAVGDVLVASIDLEAGPREVHEVVDTDGYVMLPKLGRVCVAGLTPPEARESLVARFAALGKWPSVRVEIRRGQSYFIDGAVVDDGFHELDDETTLADAVLRAQPAEDGADLHCVSLVRAAPAGVKIEHYDLVCDPRHAAECVLRSRDCVRVPSMAIEPRTERSRRTPGDSLARF